VNEASISTTEGSLYRGRMDDYIVGKEIGKGAYAIVKSAIHKLSNKKIAIKIYEKYNLIDPQRKCNFKKEIDILKKIDHSNIIKLYDVIDTTKQLLIIMELATGISLLNYLKAKPNRRMDESETKEIFYQIIKAITYLHSKNIVHRDVKLENIIIDNKYIKIIDFGFATFHQTNKLNFFCGTPSYMPPEIIQKKEYLGPPADVWSCGILLYTLLCGVFPFRATNEKELFSKIIKGSFILPEYLSQESKNLISKILNVNVSGRPLINEVLNDPWFEMLNKKNNVF